MPGGAARSPPPLLEIPWGAPGGVAGGIPLGATAREGIIPWRGTGVAIPGGAVRAEIGWGEEREAGIEKERGMGTPLPPRAVAAAAAVAALVALLLLLLLLLLVAVVAAVAGRAARGGTGGSGPRRPCSAGEAGTERPEMPGGGWANTGGGLKPWRACMAPTITELKTQNPHESGKKGGGGYLLDTKMGQGYSRAKYIHIYIY